MIQQLHSQGYTQRNVSQVAIKAPVQPCLLKHYSQLLSYRNSQDAHSLLMSVLRKSGIYVQWHFIQPQRRMKFCHLQINGWN
jgi:hypothetical protein